MDRVEQSASEQSGAVESATRAFRQIVGEEYVLTSEAALAHHSKCTIPWRRNCVAVVLPELTDQVSAILRTAGQYGLRVWPFSTGHNWGYGTTTAFEEGVVVLLLERMNRILEVNEDLAYAVIEPGVTQAQLNAYLKAQGSGLWTDCTDSTPRGSVIGNALERGVGYTPYGDHFGHLCGMEVVLPNGEVVRTGGGPAHLKTWHTYKWGTGPYIDGLFSQSNLGVVTKAGVWLMPAPESFNFFTFEMSDERNFPAAMDAVRRLALHRSIGNVHFFNDFLLMSAVMQYPYEQRTGQRLSEEVMASLRRRFRLNPWTMMGGIYGSRAAVAAHRRSIKRELGRYGKLLFLGNFRLWAVDQVAKLATRPRWRGLLDFSFKATMGRSLDLIETIPKVYPVLQGVPGEFVVSSAYFKRRKGRPASDIEPVRDDCGLIWFAPVVPASGEHIMEVRQACEPLFAKHGLDFTISIIMLNPRSVIEAMIIYYDRDDPDEASRALALYNDLVETTIKLGYQQYRTSVMCMDRILDSAPEFHRLANTIKAAVDPQNILAPGRYGIGMPDR